MPRVSSSRSWVLLVTAVILGAVAAGCASSGASPAAAPSASAASGPIAVELSEWKVVPATATTSAGSVTFAVSNKGTTIHEFVVIRTDLEADALPVKNHKVDNSILTPVDEIENIAVGGSSTLTVALDAGQYVLLCNVETHYEQGMHADFDVS